jgi:heme-degrading monooxygenase HmoA
MSAAGDIAATPDPPYVAVIFTSLRRHADDGYAVMSARMLQLAAEQPGYLGVESAKEGIGITVSYWRDEEAAKAWKSVAEHLVAQRRGRTWRYLSVTFEIADATTLSHCPASDEEVLAVAARDSRTSCQDFFGVLESLIDAFGVAGGEEIEE